MNAVEEVREPALRRAMSEHELRINEVTNLLYVTSVNNNMQQKEETGDKIKQEIDEVAIPFLKGLPLQPEGYIKYPKYDFL